MAQATPTTTEALTRIAALYCIEDELRGKPAEHRRTVRQARACPLLNSLSHYMEKVPGLLSQKSETAADIRHALSHLYALTRYADDGLLETDNSAAERLLRAVVLARTNYPFMGSDSEGERTATLYSVLRLFDNQLRMLNLLAG